MTNALYFAAQGINSFGINWTIIIAILTTSMAAMGTLIKIFGNQKKIKDEDLRDSRYLSKMEKNLEIGLSHHQTINEEIRKLEHLYGQLVEKIKNNEKDIEEIKENNKDLIKRLDDLLRQLLEWYSHGE